MLARLVGRSFTVLRTNFRVMLVADDICGRWLGLCRYADIGIGLAPLVCPGTGTFCAQDLSFPRTNSPYGELSFSKLFFPGTFNESCLELSFPGPFVLGNLLLFPGNESSWELSFHGPFVPRNFRSQDFSFPGTFVLRERKFWRTKGPGNFRSPRTKVPGNERFQEQKFLELRSWGTKVLHRDLSFLGTKGLGYEKSVIRLPVSVAHGL